MTRAKMNGYSQKWLFQLDWLCTSIGAVITSNNFVPMLIACALPNNDCKVLLACQFKNRYQILTKPYLCAYYVFECHEGLLNFWVPAWVNLDKQLLVGSMVQIIIAVLTIICFLQALHIKSFRLQEHSVTQLIFYSIKGLGYCYM